jgi:hypothetical protein
MSEYFGTQKVSTPDEKFARNLSAMASQSKAMGQAMISGGVYTWNLAGHTGRNPAQHQAVRDTFSREMLDSSYQRVYSPSDPGTSSDAKVVKLQAAYLQAMERAFRLRHSSLARSEAFSGGRRRAQGLENGPILGASGVAGYINKLIELGATS